MFEYEGVSYTMEDVQEAADQSGMKLDDYIAKAGLNKVEYQDPVEPAKTPRADQGASVQADAAPVTESNSVDSSSEQPDPPDDKFYLYKGKKYSTLELEALSMNEGLSQGDAFELTTPEDGTKTYSYEEVKEVADESGLSVKSYLHKFKQNPKYGVKVVPGGLDIQVGIELEPVEVIGSFTGVSDELKNDAKNIKRKVLQLPEEERSRAYELAFRGYDEDEREVLSNLIQGPKDFETPEDAANYINAKTGTLDYMVKTLDKELNNFELKSFINNATSLNQDISDLTARLKSASTEETPEIERQLNEKAREYIALIENNKYSVEKLNNLEKFRQGIVDESVELTAKAGTYAENELVQEAVNKRYDLTSKAIQSIDDGFSGILNSVYIPAVSLFDKDMAKAEAIYQGKRLERGRSRISGDLSLGEAADVGYLRFAAETLATNAFSTVASVLTYSGPQGLILAPITFGLSQGGGTYTDLMYQRDAASLSIDALKKQYDNAESTEAKERISKEITDLEGVKNYSDSQIITSAASSAAIEGVLTFGAGKIGQTVVPKAIKKIPKLDKFVNFVDTKGITNKVAGVIVGEVTEESSIAIMNAQVVDAFILEKDVDFSEVVNLDFVAKTIISSGGTASIAGGGQALGFIANAGTTLNDLKLRKGIQRQLEQINEQMKSATPEQAEQLRTKASALLEQITRNTEEATARFGNLDKDETAKVFNNYVKMQKIRKKAVEVSKKVAQEGRKVLDPAAKSRIDDLQKQYRDLHAENSQILNPENEFKDKDVNAEEVYMLDYYRSMKGLAKSVAKGVSFGETQEEVDVLNKIVGRRAEDITYDKAMEFIDMIKNNKDFKNLSGKDQKEIMSFFLNPENTELSALGISVPSPNLENIAGAANSPGLYNGGYTFMNNAIAQRGIRDRRRSTTSRITTAVSPVHEALHDFTSKLGMSEEQMIKIGEEAIGFLRNKLKSDTLAEADFNYIFNRIKQYRARAGNNTSEFYEEMMALYHDLAFSGVLSDNDLNNLHSFKDFIAETRKRFAGPIGGILKRDTDVPGSDVKNHLKSFKSYMDGKWSKELGDGRGPNKASLDEYDLSQFDDIQDDRGEQAEDDFVSEFDKWEAEQAAEEARPIKRPTIVEKYLGRKARDIKPLKKGKRSAKKLKKRTNILDSEMSPQALKARKTLNALAEKKGKIDLQDPETAETIWKYFKSYVPVMARKWTTNKGVVMNMERTFGLNVDDLAMELYANMRKHMENFQVAKYDADGNKISGNDSFYGWTNLVMRKRLGGIFDEMRQESPMVKNVQADTMRGLATEDASYAADIAFNQSNVPQINLIDPNDILIDTDKSRLLDIVSDDMGTSDLTQLSFKTTTSSAAEILSQYVGIPLHKIINEKSSYAGPSGVTLKTSELLAGQQWIYNNQKRLIKLLPKGAIESAASENLMNTGTRVPSNLLRAFYTKGERVTTGQGHYPFRRHDTILKADFLKAFGMDENGKPDPKIGVKSGEAQSVKGIINLYARLMSNVAMREVLAERGASPNKINDVAAGKSDFMLSIDEDLGELKRSHLNNIEDFSLQKTKVYKQRIGDKPDGFWYEVNDDWKRWVGDEMPHWLNQYYKHEHKVEIDTSDMLIIDSKEKMIEFTEEYRFDPPGLQPMGMDSYGTFYIDWPRVAKKYTGIEIPKYMYNMRYSNEARWYHTWDVASGAVWNTRAIKIVESKPYKASLDEGDSIDALMKSKLDYISMNDRELARVTAETLSAAGFSPTHVAQTIRAYRNILNDKRSMYVGMEKGQALSSYINNGFFEMMDPVQSVRQVTATLGMNLDSFVDADKGDFTPTETAKILRGKTLPNIVAQLIDNAVAPAESVKVLARFLIGVLSNDTNSRMFKNYGDAATYLNTTFKRELSGAKFFSGTLDKGQIKESDDGRSLFFQDEDGAIFQISSINVNQKAASNLGLDKVLRGEGFNELNGGKLAEQANQARKDLLFFFQAMEDARGTMTPVEVGALVSSMLEAPNNIFTRAATHDAIVIDESAKPEDYVFDVRPPASYIARVISAYLMDKTVPMSIVTTLVDNIKGIWAPKNMVADVHTLSRNTMQDGWTPDQPGAFAVYEEFAGNKGLKVTMSSEVLGTDEQQDFESLKESEKTEAKPKKKIRKSKAQEVLSANSQEEKSYLENKFDEMISEKYSEKNPHLEDLFITPGIEISAATAKNIANKVKWYRKWNLIPSSADDFIGLLYYFLERGEAGERDLQFFKENLVRPFNQAYVSLNRIRQEVATRYRATKKKHEGALRRLRREEVNYATYTNEQAIKAYLYQKAGYMPEGLNQADADILFRYVQNDPELKAYATDLSAAINIGEFWIEPDTAWLVRTIKDDVMRVSEEYMRSRLLDTWIKNKDEIFSKANLNKIEAVYGTKFRHDLEDSLYRMQHGTSRPEGSSAGINTILNWFRGSVATTMFLNMRSAFLQMISMFNYFNWEENNPVAAVKTVMENPAQWVRDIKMIAKSDYIRQRFGGLQHDLDAADLYEALDSRSADSSWRTSKNALKRFLQFGFILTRFGDAGAISLGGSVYYRNKVKKYTSEGMSKTEAEKKAFEDFQETTEEAQQSSRPDKLSREQTSTIGRIMLAFQNTTMQYTRIMNKAARDIVNGRGDLKSNIGKILYYGAIQNFAFSALQTGLMHLLFEGDDAEEEELDAKSWMVANNMLDTIIRGTGVVGALASTAKNVAIKAYDVEQKGFPATHLTTLIESANVSPAIGIKARKGANIARQFDYNTAVMKEMGGLDFKSPKDFGYSLYNPAFDVFGKFVSIAANIPVDRFFDKMKNITVATDGDADITPRERALILMGWSPWNLGVDIDKVAEAKEKIKARKKAKKDAERKAKKEAESSGIKKRTTRNKGAEKRGVEKRGVERR